VKLVFQPAEEGHAGGYHVLQEGVLDDAEAIFAIRGGPRILIMGIQNYNTFYCMK
jgi:metal-dependent amidase/aminoacylase/carboxypeptidase family protein